MRPEAATRPTPRPINRAVGTEEERDVAVCGAVADEGMMSLRKPSARSGTVDTAPCCFVRPRKGIPTITVAALVIAHPARTPREQQQRRLLATEATERRQATV